MADPVTTSETRRRAVIAHAAVIRIAESYLLDGDRNPAHIIWKLTEGSDSQITALMDVSTALARHLCVILDLAAVEGPRPAIELVKDLADRHLAAEIEQAIDKQPPQ